MFRDALEGSPDGKEKDDERGSEFDRRNEKRYLTVNIH